MKNIIAVIMGGGAGTRLFPLTQRRAKPAVPLGGKYRLIDVPVSNCINSGINRQLVLTQFNSASLNRHINRTYLFDRFSSGFVQIIAAEQTRDSGDWFQGTADAVRQSLRHMRPHQHDHALILSGDQLYRMDFREMYEQHLENDADLTVACLPVSGNDATSLGILQTAEGGRINRFVEKPPGDKLAGLESEVPEELQNQGRIYLGSMGIYLFKREILEEALAIDPSHTDFGKEIIPDAIGNKKVFSYLFDDYWSDIGTIRSFFDANLDLAKAQPAFNLFNENAPLHTRARTLPPAKLHDCTISNSIICEAAVISHSSIRDSVIGLRASIKANCHIERSIVMGADFYPWDDPEKRRVEVDAPANPGIEEGCIIRNTIIDRNVAVGKNCRITNDGGVQEYDGEFYYIRDGLVVLPKNAVVPANTMI